MQNSILTFIAEYCFAIKIIQMINNLIKQLFLFASGIFICLISYGQKSKFSLEVNYGISGNFFVRSYDEMNAPGPHTSFYNKNFIGSIGGIELKYKLNNKSSLGIAYSRSVNSRTINYSAPYILIRDFKISHTDIFDQVYYERVFIEKIPGFKSELGLFYLRMNQQEVDISNAVTFDERNYKNSKLEEGGAFLGFQYSKKIDTKFELGIKSRVYYLISTATFEAMALTPTLVYNF